MVFGGDENGFKGLARAFIDKTSRVSVLRPNLIESLRLAGPNKSLYFMGLDLPNIRPPAGAVAQSQPSTGQEDQGPLVDVWGCTYRGA